MLKIHIVAALIGVSLSAVSQALTLEMISPADDSTPLFTNIQNTVQVSLNTVLSNGQEGSIAAEAGYIYPCTEIQGQTIYILSNAASLEVDLQCGYTYVITEDAQ